MEIDSKKKLLDYKIFFLFFASSISIEINNYF